MNFFDGGPLGQWPHRFTFQEELGCGSSFLGFVLFLSVMAAVWYFFFS
jgi:hypothetical protein